MSFRSRCLKSGFAFVCSRVSLVGNFERLSPGSHSPHLFREEDVTGLCRLIRFSCGRIRPISCSFTGTLMTDLFATVFSPSPSPASPVDRFFRSSGSGRDSPRTLVAEEIIKLHIGTPPLHKAENSHFLPDLPQSNLRKRSSMAETSSETEEFTFGTPTDPSPEMLPAKRRPPTTPPPAPDEMDICEEPGPRTARVHSPPPPSPESSSDESDMCDIRPPDERTRYLRRKKRAEQIAAYRMRELKDDRDSRSARRNNSLSPKASKIMKQTVKKVKFEGY